MAKRDDVAKHAGVSAATVSHVLNNTKFVSPELKARVLAAVDDLDYVPNRAARSLASKRTQQVAILVPSFGNPHHGAIADGMEEVAREFGYTVALLSANASSNHYMTTILENQFDGLFLATTTFAFSPTELSRIADRGIVIVASGVIFDSGHKTANIGCSAVEIDYGASYRTLFGYLADLGHRRVAYLAGLPPMVQPEARLHHYLENRRAFGMDEDPALVVAGTYPFLTTVQEGYNAAKELLTRETRVTAIVAINDLMAIGALKAVREAGYRVPSEMSVVGCDDIVLAEVMDPPLTTLHFPQRDYGRMAMELLARGIAGEPATRVKFETKLIVRDSTGRAREV